MAAYSHGTTRWLARLKPRAQHVKPRSSWTHFLGWTAIATSPRKRVINNFNHRTGLNIVSVGMKVNLASATSTSARNHLHLHSPGMISLA
jgi:hypothetical protein